jgi:hypothetical protein
MKKTCYLCKQPFGLLRHKREMTVDDKRILVDVCSVACRDKKMLHWGDKRKGLKLRGRQK